MKPVAGYHKGEGGSGRRKFIGKSHAFSWTDSINTGHPRLSRNSSLSLVTSYGTVASGRKYFTMEALMFSKTTGRVPYSNCDTRIVSLLDLDLPERASEAEYVDIYQNYVQKRTPNSRLLQAAVESVKYGIAPPVAFPTETVYGLGADATNAPSIAGIFAAKGRPNDNPLIVHVASKEHLEHMTGEPIPAIYSSLVSSYWPGPLTILIPVPTDSPFATNVHPGQSTIGFRVPESKYARFFIAATDRPIAGPSANSSGKPSPTTVQHVVDDMRGKINFILDGGSCHIGVESTVVDGLHDPPLILRPGGVSLEQLIAHGKKHGNAWSKTSIGYKRAHDKLQDHVEDSAAPRAPGMKYRHYAPKGRLLLFTGPSWREQQHRRVAELVGGPESRGKAMRIGILSTGDDPDAAGMNVRRTTEGMDRLVEPWQDCTYPGVYMHDSVEHKVYEVDIGRDVLSIARMLFGALRLFDDLGCDVIFAHTVGWTFEKSKPGEEDVYDAVMERIEKAATERID